MAYGNADGYWVGNTWKVNKQEETTVNSKRINDIIDSLTADNYKQKVRELVKEIKPDFEVQPEVKAGQVWKWDNRVWWVIMDYDRRKEKYVVAGQLLSDPEYVPQTGMEKFFKEEGRLLAESLDAYFAKKQRGEV